MAISCGNISAELLQLTEESECTRLNKELFRARFHDFATADQFFTHIKTLSEQIEATKITMTKWKVDSSCSSYGLSLKL